MKKSLLISALFLFFFGQSNAQNNPINNLSWQQVYNFGNYTFALQWEEPALPHDQVIGYNIYRDDVLFRFQTEGYLTNMGINPNCGPDFMYFESNGDGFDIHVTAVYNPGPIESGYIQTEFAANNLLNIATSGKEKAILYPNPTKGLLNIGNENTNKIQVYDITGKRLAEFEAVAQIDLSNLSKGIYLIKLLSDNGVMIDKIVIE
jgi:hypothetical protein